MKRNDRGLIQLLNQHLPAEIEERWKESLVINERMHTTWMNNVSTSLV
jgi:hypothetical protein